MKNLLLIVSLILFFACQPKGETDLKALKDEVFEIHDEVMPKMGDLRRARKALMVKADSLQSIDSLKAQTLLKASENIAAANDSMMVWMRNFDPNFEGTDEEVLNYLNEKKESISKVKEDMIGSLGKGQEMLEGN